MPAEPPRRKATPASTRQQRRPALLICAAWEQRQRRRGERLGEADPRDRRLLGDARRVDAHGV